ncbi:MAG: hypothetical protein AAF353_04545 [Pseudomonadota bacterium]
MLRITSSKTPHLPVPAVSGYFHITLSSFPGTAVIRLQVRFAISKCSGTGARKTDYIWASLQMASAVEPDLWHSGNLIGKICPMMRK